MRGGDDGYGPGSEGIKTQPIEGNTQQDAAAARVNDDNETLNEVNNVQGQQQGGADSSSGDVKAVHIDSPAHDDAAGEYTTSSQVTANQTAANQGVANSATDTPPPMGGGKTKKGRKKTMKKSRKSQRKRSHKKTHKKRKGKKSLFKRHKK